MTRPNVVPWMRTGHGAGRDNATGAAQPHVELVGDEAPAGEPAPYTDTSPMPPPPYAKGSPEARECARRGGKAGKGRNALADKLGLSHDPQDERNKRAEALRQAELRHLRENVGGGKTSPVARALVKLGARLVAAAEKAFDEGRDADGAKFTENARQTFLAAHYKVAAEAAPAGVADADRAAAETFGRKGAPGGP